MVQQACKPLCHLPELAGLQTHTHTPHHNKPIALSRVCLLPEHGGLAWASVLLQRTMRGEIDIAISPQLALATVAGARLRAWPWAWMSRTAACHCAAGVRTSGAGSSMAAF